jgi:hypothetical protein
MNGPQHYREAEAQLAAAQSMGANSPIGEAAHLRYASVHATLAQVAVWADLVGDMDDAMEARKAWTEVTR